MADAPETPPPGDDPFLPEDGLLAWLPRAAAIGLVGVCVVLLSAAALHHGEYRLVRLDDGTALLERGRFAPRGWEAAVPGGAVEAWAPIAWSGRAPAPPLRGELRDLAETWLGMIRDDAASLADGDLAALDVLGEREQSFEAWYRTRWGEAPPEVGAVPAIRASWAAAELAAEVAAAEQARIAEVRTAEAAAAAAALARAQHDAADPTGAASEALERARTYSAERRALLREAEELLARLPPPSTGSAEEQRDREALEGFVRRMDTPTRLLEGER